MRSLQRTAAFARDQECVLAERGEGFGPLGRRRCAGLLKQALKDIVSDPNRTGARPVPGRDGVYAYHIRHSRRATPDDERIRRPRHVVFYRLLGGGRVVQLLRLLHERMEPQAWLPPGDEA
ncbi:type II toxin-antitoxin system RelE/ParE family toxin [Azospirillum sp. ST 5-10]|uniref:type II toxin-antitoxin system RelE/ParE family toxin n=1 Tax=unclassified Azospirillum TaxID=2630922 RepID=UPI003F4A4EE1